MFEGMNSGPKFLGSNPTSTIYQLCNLGQFTDISVPQFTHLKNVDKKRAYLNWLLGGQNQLMSSTLTIFLAPAEFK